MVLLWVSFKPVFYNTVTIWIPKTTVEARNLNSENQTPFEIAMFWGSVFDWQKKWRLFCPKWRPFYSVFEWMFGIQAPTGIQMIDLCPVVKWSDILMVVWKPNCKKPVNVSKCPMFLRSAKSRDRTPILTGIQMNPVFRCSVFRWLLFPILANLHSGKNTEAVAYEDVEYYVVPPTFVKIRQKMTKCNL